MKPLVLALGLTACVASPAAASQWGMLLTSTSNRDVPGAVSSYRVPSTWPTRQTCEGAIVTVFAQTMLGMGGGVQPGAVTTALPGHRIRYSWPDGEVLTVQARCLEVQ